MTERTRPGANAPGLSLTGESVDCGLCRLAAGYGGEIVTRLWVYHHGAVIVVTDLNPRGFAMRTLAVPVEHVHCDEADVALKERVAEALDEARELVEGEAGLVLVKRDLQDHSFRAHYHGQDCYHDPAGGAPWK